MQIICRVAVSLALGAVLCAVAVHAQDQPSLGDVARQARQQKQQKDADAIASTKKKIEECEKPKDDKPKDKE